MENDQGAEKAFKDFRRWLPGQVSDAHAHLFRLQDVRFPADSALSKGPPERSVEDWRRDMTALLGGRDHAGGSGAVRRQAGGCVQPPISRRTAADLGALFLPFPSADGDVEACNRYVAGQLGEGRRTAPESAPQSRALMLVAPETPRAHVAEMLRDSRIAGFKPYHVYSPSKPTSEAPLATYAPEWMWQLAGERGLIITLHLARSCALADEDNWRTIRTMLERYPRARLILAHAASGFNPATVAEGIHHLAGLDNVWFDSAAICEPAPFLSVLEQFGPRRLLYGSDYPLSELPGKYVSVADGFAWLCADNLDWKKQSISPAPLGVESLRALFEAIDLFGLDEADIADIFSLNLRRLLGQALPGRSPALPGRSPEKEANATQSLYIRAKSRIPGGTQLLSKRPEMFAPGQWPAYFREARGCEVWDLDGRRYFDMSYMGIGSCLLGYADPDVTRAVLRRVRLGAMATLNPPEEVELADLLCKLHPWAEQVRFARCGGEAMAVAVRIARATTKRSTVAICGYHGWQDWYLAANLAQNSALDGHLLPGLQPSGVPRELRGTVLPFHFNNAPEFDAVMDAHGKEIAAVVMEPCRTVDPAPGFLERIRERTTACGAIWVIDEITAGFRMSLGGAHLNYGASPDIAVFAKAMGNGHPMAAVIGTADAMAGAQGSFISSTYWTESVGPVAALATLRKMQEGRRTAPERTDVPTHVARIGAAVQEDWRKLGQRHALPMKVDGFPCLAHLAFGHAKADVLRTLYTQWMLDEGFLAGAAFYPSLAHTPEIVALHAKAVDKVFGRIAEALATNEPERFLRGPVAHSGFRRLT